MGSRFYAGGEIADSVVAALLYIMVIVLLVGAYLLIQAICLIVGAFLNRPKSKALWIALANLLLWSCLSLLTQGQALMVFLASISATGLLLTAWIVEQLADERVQQPPEPLVEQVLTNPWWK